MPDPSHATMVFQCKPRKETSPFKIFVTQLTVANLAAFDTAWATFKTSVIAITLGVHKSDKVLVYDTPISGLLPTSEFARRENKLLIRYSGDTTGSKHRVEMPGPDMDVLTSETGDANFIVLADAGVMAAFVTQFEALAKSPLDGSEAVSIDSVQYVGRNL